MSSRHLLYVSAGDRHLLHPSLNSACEFDIVVSHYGQSPAVRSGLTSRGIRVDAGVGGKFQNLWRMHRADPNWLSQYEAVLVLDDDLGLGAAEISRLFEIHKERELWVLQPAFDPRGRVSFPCTESRLATAFKYTNFIENGAPLFRADLLIRFLDDFDGSLTGYGTDFWYMNVLGENRPGRYGVADEVTVANPRRVKREISSLQADKDALADWENVRRTRGLRQYPPAAYLSQGSTAWGVARTAVRRGLQTMSTPPESVSVLRQKAALAKWDLNVAGALRRLRSQVQPGRRLPDTMLGDLVTAWQGHAQVELHDLQALLAAVWDCQAQGDLLEVGSGLTTTVLALANVGCDRRLVVLDNDARRQSRIRRRLRLAGLDADLRVVPLERYRDYDWFRRSDEREGFGLALVNGPRGDVRGGRLGFLEQMGEALQPGATVMINRPSAQELCSIAEWTKHSRLEFRLLNVASRDPDLKDLSRLGSG